MTDSKLTRREAVGVLAALPLATIAPSGVAQALRSAGHARSAATPFEPKFFTPHEWATVRLLVDIIIPRDARSGSATDAGVPEFMDFILIAYPDEQKWMREGLAWLDARSARREKKDFVDATEATRKRVLDDVAFPLKEDPGLKEGIRFFDAFRDLTASGFFSSRMGVEDLQYKGNTFVMEWKGCPDAVLERLGVRY